MLGFLNRVLAALAAIVITAFVFALALTSRPSAPAMLATAEYAIDPVAALQDRADARAHEQAVAAIEAEQASEASKWLTLQVFGIGALFLLGLCVTLAIRGATEIQIARLLQEQQRRALDEGPGYRIIEGRPAPARHKEIEG
jgi:hypothetical protein